MGVYLLLPVLGLGNGFAEEFSLNVKTVAVPSLDGHSTNEIQRRREVLFQRMLDVPDDLDATFEYAALSAQIGDIEAAISSLERMLIFAPGLPRLQLELGVLYYRLQAFGTARTYLETVISKPGIPDAVRLKVETMLAAIKTAEKRDNFSAQLRAGVRYQTNANRAPESANVTLNGLSFALNGNSIASPDTNAYLAGTAHFSKDLETQGDTFDVDILGYASKQVTRDELNIVQLEGTAGTSFDLGRFDIDNAVLGVYGIISGVVLSGEFYGRAFGVGTRFVAQPKPTTNILLKYEYRKRTYHKTSEAPLATLRNGEEYRLGGQVTHILHPTQLIGVGAHFQRTTAQQNYLAYREVSIWGGPTVSFVSPLPDNDEYWVGTATLGGVFRNYDGPDPVINTSQSQQDQEWFARASINIPAGKEGWSWLAESEYRSVDSNYDTRIHDNFTVSLSIMKKM